MRVIFDAEFDSLTPTRIWCIVCKDIDTEEKYVFRYDKENFRDFIRFSKDIKKWIGVNNLAFDSPHIHYLLGKGCVVDVNKQLDLLIVSRLIWYARPGGHSVKAWAKRFDMLKPEIKVYDDPDMIDEYVNRCKHDVEITHRIYLELKRHIDDPEFKKAIDMEHEMQRICTDMNENGFGFDVDKARQYLGLIETEMMELEKGMKETLPDVRHVGVDLILKRKLDGTPYKSALDALGGRDNGFLHNEVLCRDYWEPFNPASPKQRVELLNKSGWKPTEKTKTHLQCERELRVAKWKRRHKDIPKLEKRLEKFKTYGWKVNEINLQTLPPDAPAGARLLATWLSLEGRRADLVEWSTAYNENSCRIHGTFNGIGSWTHRMSHTRPNQGNIFSEFHPEQCKDSAHPSPVEDVKLRFNGVLRGLWRASPAEGGEPGAYLLGCDAEGIQMRILAHYINDENYTRTIVEGRKEDETDVHNVNRRLLGRVCRSRDDAKTFIYAWLLGAGLGKVAQILGCSGKDSSRAVRLFIEGIPGLAELKRGEIPRDARQGYFVGLDGRKVIVPSEHYVLAGYLQNGEALVMKYANILWREWAEGPGLRYNQVDFVHDEWQTEVYSEASAHQLGMLQCAAIKQAGLDLGVRCALAGDYKIGRNWRETH